MQLLEGQLGHVVPCISGFLHRLQPTVTAGKYQDSREAYAHFVGHFWWSGDTICWLLFNQHNRCTSDDMQMIVYMFCSLCDNIVNLLPDLLGFIVSLTA